MTHYHNHTNNLKEEMGRRKIWQKDARKFMLPE